MFWHVVCLRRWSRTFVISEKRTCGHLGIHLILKYNTFLFSSSEIDIVQRHAHAGRIVHFKVSEKCVMGHYGKGNIVIHFWNL